MEKDRLLVGCRGSMLCYHIHKILVESGKVKCWLPIASFMVDKGETVIKRSGCDI